MGLLVYLKARHSAANRLWIIFVGSVAIWGFGGYKCSTITDKATALLWWRLTYIGIIFIPTLFTHFVHLLLGIKRRKTIFTIYLLSVVFLIICFTSQRLFLANLQFKFSSFFR